jgi:hypothetical protein
MIDKKDLSHLSARARRWILATENAFILEPYHEELVIAAGEALDRRMKARKVIDDEGMMLVGPHGSKSHPLLAVERDAAAMFAKIVKQLKFDADGRVSTPMPGAISHHKLRAV